MYNKRTMAAHRLMDFAQHYHTRKFSKGELILVEGEVPSCAYIVKKGVIKGYAITSEGVEKPIGFDGPGEVFPVGWVFGKLRWSQYYYDAFTDCEIYCIPRDEYLDYLKHHPEALFDMHNELVSNYLYFQMRVNALEQSKAIDKIIHTLHYLALRFGREIKPHTVQITLPLSQQELANIMGLTRETTGIELNKLIKRGIVKQDRQKCYTVFTNRLNEALDIEYGQGRMDEPARQPKA